MKQGVAPIAGLKMYMNLTMAIAIAMNVEVSSKN